MNAVVLRLLLPLLREVQLSGHSGTRLRGELCVMPPTVVARCAFKNKKCCGAAGHQATCGGSVVAGDALRKENGQAGRGLGWVGKAGKGGSEPP